MRVLAIENYPKTTLGLLAEALDATGAETCIVQAHAGEPLPSAPEGFDALVLLGGAQSAVDDRDHPYLPVEAALARAFGDSGKPVLGICLGAQILARAYGADNILGRPIEFGWHAVRTTPEGMADPVLGAVAPGAPLFHWHVDTFTLPPGAVHLAESDRTELQAFRIGRNVYGIQFHFEADTGLVAGWTRDFAGELEIAAPDWFDRHVHQAAKHGASADAAGRALARAWVGLLGRPASPRSSPRC